MPYERQLERKQEYIGRLFHDVANESCTFETILGMVTPFHFRNKIASPFASGKRLPAAGAKGKGKGKGKEKARRDGQSRTGSRSFEREILYGMYAKGTHRIVRIEECVVENECGRRIVSAVAQTMRRFGIEPYDEDAGTGFMRHVVVRVGHESGEVLVTLVTNASVFAGGKHFARELVRRCPEITTVVQNVNTRFTNAIFGDEEHVLYGPGFILDTLCGLSFRISSRSFYQVNAVQTEVLYRVAVEWALEGLAFDANSARIGHAADFDGRQDAEPAHNAQDTPGPATALSACDVQVAAKPQPFSLMDAYCGTGTIGLVAASKAGDVHVVGVDKVESAIRDARMNARHNGIDNATFVTADAGEYLCRCASRGDSFDVLIMDPPRAGSSESFLRAAAESGVRRIVYISCNPETQVRDVAFLQRCGYRLERIQPVDMFPHTDHVETVVLMSEVNEYGAKA